MKEDIIDWVLNIKPTKKKELVKTEPAKKSKSKKNVGKNKR